MDLSSEDLGNCELLTGEDLLKKAGTIKIFEYSPLKRELIKQTYIVRKWYRGLNKFYGFDENEVDKE